MSEVCTLLYLFLPLLNFFSSLSITICYLSIFLAPSLFLLKQVRYLHEEGCNGTVEAFAAAARNEYLECLVCMREDRAREENRVNMYDHLPQMEDIWSA